MRYWVALLLISSGIGTAVQGYGLIVLAIWGRPTHPLQGLALLGSVLQVIAGIVVLVRPRPLVLGGIALFLTWTFWAPALLNTIRADWSHIRFKPVGAIPSVLLVAATTL
jgi:hypothetical protein